MVLAFVIKFYYFQLIYITVQGHATHYDLMNLPKEKRYLNME